MNQSAEVTSLEALLEWKAAVCTFRAEGREALSALDMEIQRNLDWLADQLKIWQGTVRKCEEEVFQAKQELARHKMMRFGDRPPDCTEQEKALKKAKARLEHAEEKVETTRRWLRQLPDLLKEFQGPARQLDNRLEADLPKADALLERKLAALEAYLQVSAGGSKDTHKVAGPVEPEPALSKPEKPRNSGATS